MKNGNFGEPWAKADLLFLRDALAHGMSPLDIARYLRRTEDEVREKSKEMRKKELARLEPIPFGKAMADGWRISHRPPLRRCARGTATVAPLPEDPPSQLM